jgi:hypothetical protein
MLFKSFLPLINFVFILYLYSYSNYILLLLALYYSIIVNKLSLTRDRMSSGQWTRRPITLPGHGHERSNAVR